jgi:hypothetical protein
VQKTAPKPTLPTYDPNDPYPSSFAGNGAREPSNDHPDLNRYEAGAPQERLGSLFDRKEVQKPANGNHEWGSGEGGEIIEGSDDSGDGPRRHHRRGEGMEGLGGMGLG